MNRLAKFTLTTIVLLALCPYTAFAQGAANSAAGGASLSPSTLTLSGAGTPLALSAANSCVSIGSETICETGGNALTLTPNASPNNVYLASGANLLLTGAIGNPLGRPTQISLNGASTATVQDAANATFWLASSIGDGAGAVAFVLNNSLSLVTAGTKLLSVQNAGVEKAYVDKDGSISVGAVSKVGVGTSQVTTAGATGVSATVNAPAVLTGQTATVASIGSVTSPNDGNKHLYCIQGDVKVTAYTSGTVELAIGFTDHTGSAQTVAVPLVNPLTGAPAIGATAVGYWLSGGACVLVNPNTTVTSKTVGTFAATYDVVAVLQIVD